MGYRTFGRLTRLVGGLYTVALADEAAHKARYGTPSPLAGSDLFCRAGGVFRHEGISPLVGDLCEVAVDDGADGHDDAGGGVRITGVLSRKNALIRPPLANLDLLYLVLSSASPDPSTTVTDKMLAVAEYNGIEPILVIGKNDLSPEEAERLRAIYEGAGFPVFTVSAKEGDGIDALRADVTARLPGKIAAFAGASGVGKSSLLNRLFPDLSLSTGAVSEKIGRGKNTTRHVELFRESGGYIADTPGFSLLDFARFDFFGREDLADTMREFRPYLGHCRYTKCSHTKEEGCAVLAAIARGEIAPSRHESYLAILEEFKNKPRWQK